MNILRFRKQLNVVQPQFILKQGKGIPSTKSRELESQVVYLGIEWTDRQGTDEKALF